MRPFAAKLDEQFAGNFGLDEGFAAMDLANGGGKFVGGHIFEQVAHSAGFDGLENIIFVIEGGEDNDTRLRMSGR